MDRFGIVMAFTRLPLVLSLAGSALPFAAWARAQQRERAKEEKAAPPPLVSVLFAFKLDPQLTRSLYMGDRWVSPPVYSSANQPGENATVEARVQGVDATGRPVPIKPRWLPADSAMVTVTPAEGEEVKITVHEAGESRLTVTSGGISRDLTVKAVRKHNAIQVEIAQVPPAGTPAGEERAGLLAGRKQQASYSFGTDFGRRLKQRPSEFDVDLFSRGLADALAGGTALPTTGSSYALGLELGRKMRGVSVELDAALVAQGVRDALRGDRALLTEAELQAALSVLYSESRTEVHKRLVEKNKQDGEAFLAENKAKEGVVTLPSGLQYKVVRAGEGRKPVAGETVVCHYRGTFVDGKEFDSTLERDKPATLPLKRVIRGFREALPLMPVGSKWQLVVPSNLAYGARGARGKVGPDATLVFELELLSIQEKPAAALRVDPAAQKLAKDAPAVP